MVPVNLIAAIQGVGFDYGMSPKEIAEGLVEGARTLWEKEATVEIRGSVNQQSSRDGLTKDAGQ